MKAVFTALIVSLVFAVFFVLFLVVPILVIAVGYFVMTSQHNRLSRKAKAARQKDDEGDDDGRGHPEAEPQDPPPGNQVSTSKPPLVESPSA